MTREKAIEEIKNYENYPNGLSKECRDYIIKALEQGHILGKIRAEIEQLSTSTCTETCIVSIDADDFKEDVLAILDKYKAETEE